ncbi:oligosaccharyl transferase, archaeosortase A system-associated [Salinarchaeum sp. IM2453]|uniref:oligosaccharyl transferase, archaeosortase A system-associated n=1 Tax=Salinarchaeum sp. IM2453 TaxID=2862870 RepID=UPI001C83FA2C|nr:oligosaccharyl transferase, archaeosortase A system-associated [Salinarchaeum sp. IM2453]QZA87976.1 oligosaccharyl transferase, archaeosortase A system-associated [Salinarchaeum sp. IM2453]
MSTETKEGQLIDQSTFDTIRQRYHIPTIFAVVLFMFWLRFRNYETFLVGEDGFTLQAVDSWYHWRTTEWTVENYPWLIGHDPWTRFPEGTFTGQFGTLFDFLIATVAMIIGGGDPSSQQILLAGAIVVPLLAALTAIPVYYLGKQIGGRIGGIAGIVFLAVAPGQFFNRMTAGQFQHHAAEALFMIVSVVALVFAIRVAMEEKPIWELVPARDWDELKRPAIYSAIAGFAMIIYIWTWPPGIVLIGIFGIYVVVQILLDHMRRQPPDHIAFVATVSMAVVAVGTALLIQEPGFSRTTMDYLPPIFALLVAGGSLFMAWFSRWWNTTDYGDRGYPVAIAGIIIGGLLSLYLVLPDLYDTLVGNLDTVFPLFILPGGSIGIVAEAQPPSPSILFGEHGLAFFSALVAVAFLFGRDSNKPIYLFIGVWAAMTLSMGITQTRFNYYTALGVAVLNAYLVGKAVELINLDRAVSSVRDIETYQVLTIVVLLMLLVVPLLPPVADHNVIDRSGATGPATYTEKGEPVYDWMNDNTPEVGNYGNASNADEIDYYGDYDIPEDSNFDYPEGAYGVMSWWDYGHLLTTQAERPPHSNPFQHNVETSATYLTETDEEKAELLLDAIAADVSDPSDLSKEELQNELENVDESEMEPIQYVSIHDRDVGGIFPAIAQRTDNFNIDDGFDVEKYESTMIAELYYDDADGLENYRLVKESPYWSNVQMTDEGPLHEEYGDPQTGELYEGPYVFEDDDDAYSATKLFERVDGATLTGEVGNLSEVDVEEATITAELELFSDTARTFEYSQTAEPDENGEFELTVPYPSNEEYGPDDGFAESAITPLGDSYQVNVENETGDLVKQANVAVNESDVQFGKTQSVEFEPANVTVDIDRNESNLDVNKTNDENLTAVVDIENVGSLGTEQTITASLDGEEQSSEEFDLAALESETHTFELDVDLTDDGAELMIESEDDSDTAEISVFE